jgi:hypothetical protein
MSAWGGGTRETIAAPGRRGRHPVDGAPVKFFRAEERAKMLVRKAIALSVLVVAMGLAPHVATAATRYAVADGNWNRTAPTIWATSAGGATGASIPVAGDTVHIAANGGSAHTVTIPAGYAAACSILDFNNGGGALAGTLTFAAATSTLSVSGNVTMYRTNNPGATSTIGIGAGSMTVGGVLELSNETNSTSTSTARISTITISTGSLTVQGNLVMSAAAALQSQIVFSGAGTMNLQSAFTLTHTLGTLTPSTGTVNFNGSAAAQTIPIGVSSVTYYNLTTNNTNAGGATLSAAITTTNVTGNLSVQSGTLNNGGFAIALAANRNFSVANGATFNLTGTSAMVTVSGTGTRTFGATSTVSYTGGTQAVAAATYGNLLLSNPSGTNNKTMVTGTSVVGNLSIAPSGGTARASIGAGVNVPVGTLTLGGLGRSSGTWGSTGSTASHQNNTYFLSTASGIVTVTTDTRLTPVITWSNPAGITYPTALSGTQLNATAVPAGGSFVYNPVSGTVLNAGNGQTLSVTYTPTDLTTYTTANANVSIDVAQASSSVSVWPTASAITYGQSLSSSALTGGTATPPGGTFTFDSPTFKPNAPSYSAAVTYTPALADQGNYSVAHGNVTVTVNQAASSVSTWPTASAINYGQALSASTLSGGTATPSGGTFTFDNPAYKPNAGSYSAAVTYTPALADQGNYSAAHGSVSVQVNQTTTVVNTWPTASGITYGQALSASSLTGGDSTPGGGTFTFDNPAYKPDAGSYSAAVTYTPPDPTNYSTVGGNVNVAVAQKGLTITAHAESKAYTDTDPELHYDVVGLVDSTTPTGALHRAAGECAAGSPYAIDIGSLDYGSNYSVDTFNSANFTITFGAPTGLGITSMVTAGPTLTWDSVTGATKYYAYRLNANGVTWDPVGDTTAPPFDEHTAPLSNTRYEWSVVASNEGGTYSCTDLSLHSASVSGRTALVHGYNQVSCPYETGANAPTSVYGSWADNVFIWVPTPIGVGMGQWEAAPLLVLGYGQYVWAHDESTVLSSSITTPGSLAFFTLAPGWNQIGDPGTGNITVDPDNWIVDEGTPSAMTLTAAIAANHIGGDLYWFAGATDTSLNISTMPEIEPWKGYWLANLDTVPHTLTMH